MGDSVRKTWFEIESWNDGAWRKETPRTFEDQRKATKWAKFWGPADGASMRIVEVRQTRTVVEAINQ